MFWEWVINSSSRNHNQTKVSRLALECKAALVLLAFYGFKSPLVL